MTHQKEDGDYYAEFLAEKERANIAETELKRISKVLGEVSKKYTARIKELEDMAEALADKRLDQGLKMSDLIDRLSEAEKKLAHYIFKAETQCQELDTMEKAVSVAEKTETQYRTVLDLLLKEGCT